MLLARLRDEPVAVLAEAPLADDRAILAVHDAAYVAELGQLAERGGGVLDPDTTMSAGSWEAARRSAGGAVAAMEVAIGQGRCAFSAGRPPGHHALRGAGMGFCLLGNAAIAAYHALSRGLERVLIVDWDVHHGNGTQALVEREPRIRFVSLHQWPWWPGTGAADERGVGNVWNVPRPEGLPPERYVADLWGAVAEATSGWRPQATIVSAGFDCLQGDPLGGFTLEPGHIRELTERLRALPGSPPLVGVLEGGYIPSRLADGVIAQLGAMQ